MYMFNLSIHHFLIDPEINNKFRVKHQISNQYVIVQITLIGNVSKYNMRLEIRYRNYYFYS